MGTYCSGGELGTEDLYEQDWSQIGGIRPGVVSSTRADGTSQPTPEPSAVSGPQPGAARAPSPKSEQSPAQGIPRTPTTPQIVSIAGTGVQTSQKDTTTPIRISGLRDTHMNSQKSVAECEEMCHNCGAFFMVDAAFCRKCGAKRPSQEPIHGTSGAARISRSRLATYDEDDCEDAKPSTTVGSVPTSVAASSFLARRNTTRSSISSDSTQGTFATVIVQPPTKQFATPTSCKRGSARSQTKVCKQCSRPFSGWSDTCGECRKSPTGSVTKCRICGCLYHGHGEHCEECCSRRARQTTISSQVEDFA